MLPRGRLKIMGDLFRAKVAGRLPIEGHAGGSRYTLKTSIEGIRGKLPLSIDL
jgi:hypothetical protein